MNSSTDGSPKERAKKDEECDRSESFELYSELIELGVNEQNGRPTVHEAVLRSLFPQLSADT